jgi:hypothetical protein
LAVLVDRRDSERVRNARNARREAGDHEASRRGNNGDRLGGLLGAPTPTLEDWGKQQAIGPAVACPVA